MANDSVNPACDQFVLLTNFKRGRPVESQVRVGAPEDEEPSHRDDYAQPACPNWQGIVCRIQPVCSGVDNRNNDSPTQEHEKQSYFLRSNEALAHLFLSAFFVNRCPDDHFNHEGDKVNCCEDIHFLPLVRRSATLIS